MIKLSLRLTYSAYNNTREKRKIKKLMCINYTTPYGVYKLSVVDLTVNTGVMWLSKNTLKSYIVRPLSLKYTYYMNKNSSHVTFLLLYLMYIFSKSWKSVTFAY